MRQNNVRNVATLGDIAQRLDDSLAEPIVGHANRG
jgi:hypothetical protein